MKTPIDACSTGRRSFGWVAFLVVFTLTSFGGVPSITAIHPDRSGVVVQIQVPAGFERVTLESRSQLGEGTWSPVEVIQHDGSATNLLVTLKCSRSTELIRVRADARQPLPASFYKGTTSFAEAPASTVAVTASQGGGVPNGGTPVPADGGNTRTVVESDIWKIDGDRLYFFNQYRGLQVIDITSPDNARVVGTLSLPAAGEQMYVPDPNHVVLLANGPCSGVSENNQVYVLDVSNNSPLVVTNLQLDGWVQDSRMVGTALYVASQTYRTVAGSSNMVWEWGTRVSSFDLTNPDKPAPRNTLWFSGYANVVMATDTYLFVANQDPTNWWQSVVQIVDITSPDGAMTPAAAIETAGTVPDKFKLNYANSVLTTISEDWRAKTGQGPITRLETFRLPDPRSMGPGGIMRLGEMELGSGEQLHATRFDGDRVYVVTFFQIDPLWVVDLSNPVLPHIAGSVNVPGWSSYIEPLGDRLVSVGLEGHRVAVSLFDVHDPTQPGLLSRVILGENYSWSEANYDEKAFTVLTDQGLILVPYNGVTTNGWTSQVQLIDLNKTNLVARGIIDHQVQPRRTTFSHNRILSLSGWELLSVDATDRDQPAVKGDAELAWSVGRVFVQGDYLLQLSGSTSPWGWGYLPNPAVRVSGLDKPDNILGRLELTGWPITGASVQEGRLYLVQSQGSWYPFLANGLGGSGDSTNSGMDFTLTVVDTTKLPELSILGQTTIQLDTSSWGAAWNPFWVKSDVVVWTGGGSSSWFWPPIGIFPAGGGLVPGSIIYPWWGFNTGGKLLAFDVGNPAAPAFVSEVNLTTNGWWNFSQGSLSGTRVYLSHSQSNVETNADYPDGYWWQSSQLDVIDFADPHSPAVRNPVPLPGALQGLSHSGDLLYTVGTHWTTNQPMNWTQWLDASAYDGVAAHLVASLALSNSWPRPLLLLDTNIFIGHSGYSWDSTNVIPHKLETWSLSDTGNFVLNGSVELAQPANNLLERAGLLICQESDYSIDLFDDSKPAALSLITRQQPAGCLWPDLTHADAVAGRGLWIPLGDFGVEAVLLQP